MTDTSPTPSTPSFTFALAHVVLSIGLLVVLGAGGAVIAIRRATSVDPLVELGADW